MSKEVFLKYRFDYQEDAERFKKKIDEAHQEEQLTGDRIDYNTVEVYEPYPKADQRFLNELNRIARQCGYGYII